jgi:pyruvate/2-oxoacid:ferredoxin oxidoreductase beta subunit
VSHANTSEGTRDSVFERWAHSADGRSGSLASGIEIAISLHDRRAKAAEVTAG